MYYEIQTIESCADNDHTQTIVWFWKDRREYLRARMTPLFEEEFISDLRDSATRIVRDASGQLKLSDGTFVDSATLVAEQRYDFARETVALDPSEQVIDYIESFLEQREPDILAGRLGRTRVNRATRVRPVTERTAIARDSRIRSVVRVPREPRVREVRR